MSPQLIKYNRKVDSLRDILKQHGFENLEFFWYNDGIYRGNWKDMSVSMEKPDNRDTTFTLWNFEFRSTPNYVPNFGVPLLSGSFKIK